MRSIDFDEWQSLFGSPHPNDDRLKKPFLVKRGNKTVLRTPVFNNKRVTKRSYTPTQMRSGGNSYILQQINQRAKKQSSISRLNSSEKKIFNAVVKRFTAKKKYLKRY